MITLPLTQDVSAASKISKINKFLRAETTGGKKMSDLCQVIAITENGNATLKLKDCEPVVPPVDNQTEPPIDNDTQVPPVVNDTQPPIDNDTQVPPVNDTNPIPDNDTTPTPEPQPVPENQTVKNVIMVGDIYGSHGVNVAKAIKAKDPELVVLLGDLGYSDNLNYLKANYGDLGNKLACIIGNHESSLITEAKNYCANDFYIRDFNGAVFFGVNTDGNLDQQLGLAQALVMNPQFMENVTSVHVMTHKPCAVPPNSHHTVETDVKTFCDSLKAKVPKNVTLYFDAGHNHVLSESADGQYKQAGGGGRDLYSCGISTAFPFCKSTYGFLEYTIEPNGETTSHFYNEQGGLIK